MELRWKKEPTMKEIAEWLREAAADKWASVPATEWLDRAAQVEAMGERRCGSCLFWVEELNQGYKTGTCGLSAIDDNSWADVADCGPDFCCIHWKRKEG